MTYASFVCDCIPLKEDQFHVHVTVGIDKLDYNNNSSSLAYNLLQTKILLNSAISNAKKGSCFVTLHVKKHFIETPTRDTKCMDFKYYHVPDENRVK